MAQHKFPIRCISVLCVCVCVLVRVTMVDKNRAVVCCLLATSAIMLSEKKKRERKMWCKKWYLKRNISCDVHLLNELLETDVPWDDAFVVSAGKLKKLWFPWVNCAVLGVKDDWKGRFWGLRYCLSKLRSLLSFSVRYDVTQSNRSGYQRVYSALKACRSSCKVNRGRKRTESEMFQKNRQLHPL